MLGLIAKSFIYLFPGGRTLKLIKIRAAITNSADSLILTKNITLTVINCCSLPPLYLAAHCISAGALITVLVVSPNLLLFIW